MSSRQLRKLQQARERELDQTKFEEEELAEESEASTDEPTPISKPSLFANFAALDDEGVETEPETDDDPIQSDLDKQSVPMSVPTVSKKAKLSKKKKKKGKTESAKVLEKPSKGTDGIDAAIEALSSSDHRSGARTQQNSIKIDPRYQAVCALLAINTQHLKVGNEMRNLFGRTATDNHDEAGGPVGRAAQRRQPRQVDLESALKGRHHPGKGLPELTLRRNNLIQGKDVWPKSTTGGLTMTVLADKPLDGTLEFRFCHDAEYQHVQTQFHQYVEIGDPQNLIGSLIKNPYNISLLIQVSKIAKDQGDHALSSDLLERALFSFGRAATTVFNTKLSQGKARLDFARPENREFWLAGFQYIKSLMQKGTYRTAFEWAKLLLSLSPERDPYSMRLMIHHLALRCRQFQWLLEFSACGIGSKGIMTHNTPSFAFAAMQLQDGANCRKLLRESMSKLPWLFCRLFQELNLTAPPSIWGTQPRSDAETLFTEIYVLQTKDLWNAPEATALLMEVAHAITKVNLSKLPQMGNDEVTQDVVRWVYVDDNQGLMSMAPSHLLHQSNSSDSDPLPPPQSTYSYPIQKEVLEGKTQNSNDFNDPIAAMARLIPGFAAFGFPARARQHAHDEDENNNDGGGNDGEEGGQDPFDDDFGGPNFRGMLPAEVPAGFPAPDDMVRLREDYEQMLQAREGPGGVADGQMPPAGVFARLMGMFLGRGPVGTEEEDDGSENDNWDQESSPGGVMPGRFSSGSEDGDMPELVLVDAGEDAGLNR